MKRHIAVLITFGVFATLPIQANALVINTYTDEASFLAAAGSVSLEDFNDEADGFFTSRDFGDFQVDLLELESNYKPKIESGELRLQIWDSNSVSELTFNTGISAFGLDWRNTDNNDAIELLVDEQSFTFGFSEQEGFFGIIATSGLFNTVGLSDSVGGGGAVAHGYFDNILYSSVPIPAAAWLFVSGLLGLYGIARPKKAV